jgi:hypothetical protein
VWWLFRSRTLRGELFVTKDGAYRLGKSMRQPFFANYELAARPWRRYLRLQTYRIAEAVVTMAPDLPEVDL